MTDETTNPNRWTATVAPSTPGGWNTRISLGDRAWNHWFDSRDDADELAEQINRPAPTAPADDLPPGVERDYHLTPNAEMPNGWRATEVSGLPTHVTKWGTRVPIERIPAEPATEWVPWWEALRDARKVRASNVAWITCTEMRTVDGVPWVGKQAVGWAAARADGKVEVLR